MILIDWFMRMGKWILGGIAGLWGVLFPLHTLIVCVVVAICIDFITGNIADYHRHKRSKTRYRFQSDKAWKTCWKLGLSIVGMGFAWMLDIYVLAPATTVLNLANFFATFIIGTEFWSYLENAAIISDHPVFRALRKQISSEIKDKTNINIEECDNDQRTEE